MLNPCCCITPRIGAFIFAIIDLIASISNILYIIRHVTERFENWIELVLAVLLIFAAVLLLVGAFQNSIEKLRLWVWLWIILIICIAVFLVFNIVAVNNSFDRARSGSSTASLIIFAYELWVVLAYIHELRYGPAGLTYCPSQIV